MITLILAAGDNSRWNGRIPKQLAEINGQYLIKRTAASVDWWGQPMIVTHNQAIKDTGVNYFEPQFYRWTVETLLSTRKLWQQRTVVLLGDVVYSPEALETIFGYCGPMSVLGRRWEIFAVSFAKSVWAEVILALENAKYNAEQGGRGKLWEFYRSYCHIPLKDVHSLESDVFAFIEDYTDDLDTLNEYHEFLQKNQWAGYKDMSEIIRIYGPSPAIMEN